MTVFFAPVDTLLVTEETDPQRVDEVVAILQSSKVWTVPICVEVNTNAVMDGHHRLAAAKILGLDWVPVRKLSYDQVEVAAWRPGESVSKDEILRRAIAGEPYPAKTTRHIFAPASMGAAHIALDRLRGNAGESTFP
jgi:hypothetical protein